MTYGGAHYVRRSLIVLPRLQTVSVNVAVGESLVDIDGEQPGISAVIAGQSWNVFPVIPGGFLEGQESIVTNANSTYIITNEINLGGTWEFFDGTAFSYTRGAGTGTASFDWLILDYDGLGNNAGATYSRTIL